MAQEWPHFETGLRDLISDAEFAEMRLHGPKIADVVAKVIAEVREQMTATAK